MSIEPQDVTQEDEEEQWDEEAEDDDEDDDDIDAEAEEIARKLWADISRDQPEPPPSADLPDRTATSVDTVDTFPAPEQDHFIPKTEEDDSPSLAEPPVLRTIRKILHLLSLDSQASDIVHSWTIPPELGHAVSQRNVLDELHFIATQGNLEKSNPASLGNAVLELVTSDVLVSRTSSEDKMNLPSEKRKREEERPTDLPLDKRPRISSEGQELVNRLGSAVQQIQLALEKSSVPLDIPSLATPLEQIYAFAVSASRALVNPLGYEAGALQLQLQEISGLIQVLGVLGGMPFTENPSSGTTVFPCITSCGKTFHSYTTLTHHSQATHSSTNGVPPGQGEKVHQCTHCRQSFLRLHDLKRHLLTHAVYKHAFQCGGCQRVFSRRDAAKRHKDGAREKLRSGELKAQSDKARCGEGQIIDVQQDLSGSMTDKFPAGMDEDGEEGELPRTTLSQLYGLVLDLAIPLRNGVSSVPGKVPESTTQPEGSNPSPPNGDPSLEEAIKSVLALASQQTADSGSQLPQSS